MLADDIELTLLRSVIERKGTCAEAAREVIVAVHDYLFAMAETVSNLKKPYTDNDYGRAAATILRCWHPDRINDILSQPPYN